MKRIVVVSVLLIAFFTVFAQQKRALIIAVGDYDYATTRWRPINSLKDVPIIKAALLTQGFEESKISVLTNQNADKD
jgi:hypothetical protein